MDFFVRRQLKNYWSQAASKIAQDGFKLAKMAFETVKMGEDVIFGKCSGIFWYQDAFEMGHSGYD